MIEITNTQLLRGPVATRSGRAAPVFLTGRGG
jgi:hypothetical protein